jgi:hypothetical protein
MCGQVNGLILRRKARTVKRVNKVALMESILGVKLIKEPSLFEKEAGDGH